MFLLSRPVYGDLLDEQTVKGGHTLAQDRIVGCLKVSLNREFFVLRLTSKTLKVELLVDKG